MYAHPNEVDGDGFRSTGTTTITTTTNNNNSYFHWFKINYLILLIACGFLLHINMFQAYVEEPYLSSNMNTATTSSDGKVKQHQEVKPVETTTTTKSMNATSNQIDGGQDDDDDDDDSKTSSYIPNGMDPTKLKLSDLIDTDTYRLKVNVTDMIDFATIGNPKTGTSFMSEWFYEHPDILTPKPEMRAMQWPKTGPGKTVEIMFPLIKKKTHDNKLGYKCPADVRTLSSLRNLRDYFPKTKLIVGKCFVTMNVNYPVSFYSLR